MANTDTNTVGSVMVVGGGVAGIQAALDLANSGFFVYLVEKASAIGGTMSQLDKTFPTNDCSMCIISPKLVECGQHPNIELLTLSELTALTGRGGALYRHGVTAASLHRPDQMHWLWGVCCGLPGVPGK